ncbi:MAG: FlgD immunoglobulin-like domain containing protein [Candidatus Zixiibacteriota bacterium]
MFRNLLFIVLVLVVVLSQGWTRAEIYMTLDEPFSGFSSNDVGDIVYMDLPGGERIIWVGTARGISKTSDGGASWSFYDQRNGLNQNIVSALAVSGTTLWAATAYSKLVQGTLWPYGSGFNKTDDLGDNWESLTPAQLNFAGEVSYDMATDDTTVWAAAWYGGLIRSQDGGQTWENLFVDSAAQKDFEEGRLDTLYRNYLFAVAVDTLCPLDKRLKNWINDVAYDGKLVWVATRNGLHSSVDLGKSWFAYDTTSGLNSNAVLSLTGDTSSFWAGLYQEEGVYPFQLLPPLVGADFNRTTDYGATWASSHPDQGQASSLEELPYDITLADTVVWAACGRGGLIRSFDRGQTWENVFVDKSAEFRFEQDLLEENDVFTSLAVDTFDVDTTVIWAGTRDGVYKFIFTTSDSADTVFHYLATWLTETNVILSIGIQRYDDGKAVWLGGYKYLGHHPPPHSIYGLAYKSTDGGETWDSYLDLIPVRDFAFQDSVVWAATHQGLKRSTDGGGNWDTFEIIDSTSGETIIPSQFTSVCVVPGILDTIIFVGSVDGLASSKDDGVTWEVTKFAQSFKKAIWAGTAAGIFKFIFNYRNVFDTVLHYSYWSNNITGDWIVALAIQEHDGEKVIWAGTQRTFYGWYGASFSTDDGDSWDTTLVGDEVWNFAFDDTVIWTATSDGLKRSNDWGGNWEVFNYMEDEKDKISSTEFTSVTVIDGEVWAGNVDGLVNTRDDGGSWDVIRTAQQIGSEGSETAYAYPSPFSPILESGQVIRIHYRPNESGPVTIKIYDFAMNLVITLADGEQRIGGGEYDELWDGKNEKGDFVANGVYFFKVKAPGGQTEWGKLVILK